MEIYQLIYATTLAKYCNFSNAAAKLFITQPSLSQQILKLEQELGFPVFNRNTKSVSLTYAGEQFIKDANKVICEYELLKSNIEKINKSLNRTLIFGTTPTSSILIAGSIKRFYKTFPQVDFKLVEAADTELVDMVRNRDINLAFLVMPQNDSYHEDLKVIPIKQEYICAAVNKNSKLAGQEFVTIKDLEHEELVFSSSRSIARELLLSLFNESESKLNEIVGITSIEARANLIVDGVVSFGITTLFGWGNHPEIVLIPIKPSIDVLISLIYPAGQEMTLAENSLIDIICSNPALTL